MDCAPGVAGLLSHGGLTGNNVAILRQIMATAKLMVSGDCVYSSLDKKMASLVVR